MFYYDLSQSLASSVSFGQVKFVVTRPDGQVEVGGGGGVPRPG